MTALQTFLGSALIFFCCLPYIGLAVMPSDIQPVAMLLAFLFLMSLGTVLVTREIAVLGFLALMSVVSLINSINDINFDLMVVVRASFGLFSSPIILASALIALIKVKSRSILMALDFVLFVVFLGFALNILGLSNIIQIFVNRSVFDLSELSGRGLTSFFPEQARIPTAMAVVGITYYSLGGLNTPRLLLCFLAGFLSGAGQFYVNLGVIALCLLTSVLCYSIFFNRLRLWSLVASAIITFSVLFVLIAVATFPEELVSLGLPSRGVWAISEIMHSGIAYIGTDLGILFKITGITMPAAMLLTYPLNFSLDSTRLFFTDPILFQSYQFLLSQFFAADYFPLARRPYSIFGAWVVDFSLIGLIVSSLFILSLASRILTASREKFKFSLFVFLFMMFFFFLRSVPALPYFWLLCAVFMKEFLGPRYFGRAY